MDRKDWINLAEKRPEDCQRVIVWNHPANDPEFAIWEQNEHGGGEFMNGPYKVRAVWWMPQPLPPM